MVRETLNRPESYNFYDPDVIILASNEKDNTNGLADCACAMENMFLMAQELGIGSCWINQLKEICDEPQVRAELKKFGVPHRSLSARKRMKMLLYLQIKAAERCVWN